MTKIREIVEIKGGYTSYVDLYEEFKDPVKNHGRMSRYKPITRPPGCFRENSQGAQPVRQALLLLAWQLRHW